MKASQDFPAPRALNQRLREFAEPGRLSGPLVHVRFLRNVTTEPIDPFLTYHLGNRGLRVQISHGDYDAMETEIFSGILSTPGETNVIVTALCLDRLRWGDGKRGFDGSAAFDYLAGWWERILATEGPVLAVHTFLPAWDSLGADDPELLTLNRRIREWASTQSRVILSDFDSLARTVGLANAREPRFWYLYQAPYQEGFLNAWAVSLAAAMGHRLGKSKKLLLLDCDNTLWGGVVGEDGLEGIKLNSGSYPGRAWFDFQNQVCELVRRGVLVGLVSKNNEADVFEVFDRHPSMRLKREHLAGWRVNWENKADNIRSLAEELNLGLDSVVFIDDSPHECEQVRGFLPMVDVLPLRADPWEITSVLSVYNGFPMRQASAEDSRRTAMYREESERRAAQSQFASQEDYLRSLDLRVTVRLAGPDDLGRVAQLTQRTNQFNLATNRYGEAEIARMLDSDRDLVLLLEVADRFGDYGKVGLTIASREAEHAVLRDFLLSCRVLGRRVETAFLATTLDQVFEKWPIGEVWAAHVPSEKNAQTADFYDRHGGDKIAGEEGGRKEYRFAREKAVEIARFVGTVSFA
jgi:FkbH-like protein